MASDTTIPTGSQMWAPSAERVRASQLTGFCGWLENEHDRLFDDYQSLWRWSVSDIEEFWEAVWRFYAVDASTPYGAVLSRRVMPGAQWFVGSELNYARHIFKNTDDRKPAVLAAGEGRATRRLGWAQLEEMTATLERALSSLGVTAGDVVVGYVPNIPEALAGLLSVAALGAIWACCSPDLAHVAVTDRLIQLRPKVLIATDAYQYSGRRHDRRVELDQIVRKLPSLEAVILLPGTARGHVQWDAQVLLWEDLPPANKGDLAFEEVSFSHPLWVLFTSGSTGKPKAVVHSHGGMLLEHLKVLGLQMDLGRQDTFLWYTSSSWMVWNQLVSTLLVGSTIVLYDGNPLPAEGGGIWEVAQDSGVTCLGVSPALLASCRRRGIKPSNEWDLAKLRTIVSGGAPMSPSLYDWVYEAVAPDVWLDNASGGTEVCSGLVGGAPTLPVYRGFFSCRYLGAKVEVLNGLGELVLDETGEMVITEPMPAMPVRLWGDPDGSRYRKAYFYSEANVWHHGDAITLHAKGTCEIWGRADATLNRDGIRLGSSEICDCLESHAAVLNSMVLGIELADEEYWMPAFVVLREGVDLDDRLQDELKQRVIEQLSVRHMPDDFVAVPAVPLTPTGKKLEVPLKRILAKGSFSAHDLDSLGSSPELLSFLERAISALERRPRATVVHGGVAS